jgi:hypothetical protein
MPLCGICKQSEPSEFYNKKSKKLCKKCHIIRTTELRRAKRQLGTSGLEQTNVPDGDERIVREDLLDLREKIMDTIKNFSEAINDQCVTKEQLKLMLKKHSDVINSQGEEIEKLRRQFAENRMKSGKSPRNAGR